MSIRDREFRGAREATALCIRSQTGVVFALDSTGTDFSIENIGGVPMIQRADGSLVEIPIATAEYAPVDLVSASNIAGTYSTTALTLTVTATGALTVDGVAGAIGKRYLLTAQSTGAQNGIYKMTADGAGSTHPVLMRDVDANASGLFVKGAVVAAKAGGTTYGSTLWMLSFTSPFTLDSSTPSFTQTATAVTESAVRTALAALTANPGFNSKRLTLVADPSGAQDAATKAYVDGSTVAHAASSTGAPSATAAPTFTGTAYSKSGYVAYSAPLAAQASAGTSTIVADVAISAVALTLAAQPDVPRKLVIYKTDGDSSYAATLTIVGKGPSGETISGEVVSLLSTDGTHTYTTTNAYSVITSATVSALSGNTGADKIAIGLASALGLPIPSAAASVAVYKEAAGATIAATPVNETVGTVDTTARTVVPTTAADGTKALHFWFSYTLTPAGTLPALPTAAHTHQQVT